MKLTQVRVFLIGCGVLLTACDSVPKVEHPKASGRDQPPAVVAPETAIPSGTANGVASPPSSQNSTTGTSMPGTALAALPVCQAGYFCPAGSPLPFGAGLCPAGVFCPEKSTTPAGAGQCQEGYFCPAGSKVATGEGKCPAGYLCPKGSKTGKENPSGQGYFSEEGSAVPKECGKGSYCPNLVNVAPTKCRNSPDNGEFVSSTEANGVCTLQCRKNYALVNGACVSTQVVVTSPPPSSAIINYSSPGNYVVTFANFPARTITLMGLQSCAPALNNMHFTAANSPFISFISQSVQNGTLVANYLIQSSQPYSVSSIAMQFYNGAPCQITLSLGQ